MIKPPVGWLSRFVPKVVALLLAGAGIAAVVGVLVYGVFGDLEAETEQLGARAPGAAASLEERE
ncbi:MAG: hypothetical protein GEV08_23465, partial [Acidimicrobiia bacterium]|nr:hypothetical protein [Acidimicrobiia bacterium]